MGLYDASALLPVSRMCGETVQEASVLEAAKHDVGAQVEVTAERAPPDQRLIFEGEQTVVEQVTADGTQPDQQCIIMTRGPAPVNTPVSGRSWRRAPCSTSSALITGGEQRCEEQVSGEGKSPDRQRVILKGAQPDEERARSCEEVGFWHMHTASHLRRSLCAGGRQV